MDANLVDKIDSREWYSSPTDFNKFDKVETDFTKADKVDDWMCSRHKIDLREG